MQIPDAIEPAVGWRVWNVITDRPGGGIFIGSVSAGVLWPHFKPMEAICKKARQHAVPAQNCTCGIYAAATRERLQTFGYHFFDLDFDRLSIMGEVSLWGGIIPGNHGWRAQFAYPKRFWVPYSLNQYCKPLRTAYGVPTKLSNPFK